MVLENIVEAFFALKINENNFYLFFKNCFLFYLIFKIVFKE